MDRTERDEFIQEETRLSDVIVEQIISENAERLKDKGFTITKQIKENAVQLIEGKTDFFSLFKESKDLEAEFYSNVEAGTRNIKFNILSDKGITTW